MAFLLLVSKRLWPAIILADIAVALSISLYFGRFGASAEMLFASTTPILVYASGIAVYQKFIHTNKEDVDRFILLFLIIGIATVFNSTVLVLNGLLWGSVAQSAAWSLWSAFALGDFIGVLLITPIVVGAYNRKMVNYRDIEVKLSLIVVILLCVSVAAYTLNVNPNAFAYIKLMMFGVMFFVAYHYSWVAVLITAWLTTIALALYNSFYTPEINVIEEQIFIIILSITGFLLSSSLLEKHKYVTKLLAQNRELLLNKQKIKGELAQNQALANKLVVAQEIERMHISRDMHDEVGQNITALKTNLRVIEALNENKNIQPIINIVYDLAESIYKISYDIMYRLRPVTLNQIGLSKSIQTAAFTSTLDAANIHYNVELSCNIEMLDKHVQTAIYRIIQETMNNAVKYSKAQSFNVTLRQKPKHLFLHIWDDGIGFDVQQQKRGVGISGIQERVYALKGKLKLSAGVQGTQYHIGISTED